MSKSRPSSTRARPTGRIAGRLRQFTCGCCDWSRSNGMQRQIEKRQWRKTEGVGLQ
jgi:hypothetical protein